MSTARLPGAAALLAAAALPSCVERKLVIESDPPGAVVTLEDEVQEGRTPLEVPFHWDGVRRVTLAAPGHEVLETTADVEARWYDWFPLDVVAEFLWPMTIRDERRFEFRLKPYVESRADFEPHLPDLRARLAALKTRAAQHRAGGSDGPGGETAAPPAAEEPPPPPPPARSEEPPPPPPPLRK